MAQSNWVKISDVTNGIVTTLKLRPELEKVMGGTGLRESINEFPTVQVWFVSKDTVSDGGTERATMASGSSKPMRKTSMLYHIDLYTRPRTNLGQDLSELEALIDVIDQVMEDQNRTFFGINGVKAFNHRAEFANFEYNDIKYVGVRWFVNLILF